MNLGKHGGFLSAFINFGGICNLNVISLSNFGKKSEIGNLNKIDLTGFDARNSKLNKIDLTNFDASKKSEISNLNKIGNVSNFAARNGNLNKIDLTNLSKEDELFEVLAAMAISL